MRARYYADFIRSRTVTAALVNAPHIVARYFERTLRKFVAEYANFEADMIEGFTRTFDLKSEIDIQYRDDTCDGILADTMAQAKPIIDALRRAAGRQVGKFQIEKWSLALAGGRHVGGVPISVSVALIRRPAPGANARRPALKRRFLAPFVEVNSLTWKRFVAGVTLAGIDYDKPYPFVASDAEEWREELDWEYTKELLGVQSYNELQKALTKELGTDFDALMEAICSAIDFIAERYTTYTYWHLPGPGGDEPEPEDYAPLGGEFEYILNTLGIEKSSPARAEDGYGALTTGMPR